MTHCLETHILHQPLVVSYFHLFGVFNSLLHDNQKFQLKIHLESFIAHPAGRAAVTELTLRQQPSVRPPTQRGNEETVSQAANQRFWGL